MVRDTIDRTDQSPLSAPATQKHTAAEMQAARDRLESAFAEKAKEYLAGFQPLKLVDGGVTLFSIGVRFTEENGIRYPKITDDQLTELLRRAQTDNDAYKGALYISRLWLSRRKQLPPPLLSFVLKVLSGHVVKPKGGRTRAVDTQLRAFMYAWALFVSQGAPDISLVRTEYKKKGWADWSTCDLVARAFSKAGKHTTYQQVKSYCYDQSYWHVRAVASLSWRKGRAFEDPGRDFDFDLDAFCFGKP